MKNTFAAKTFAAKTFASGHWTGVGVESTATVPNGIDYAHVGARPHFATRDKRPHFAVIDKRPHFKAGE